MEADDRLVLDAWMANWSDLIDFEVHPVFTSEEAGRSRRFSPDCESATISLCLACLSSSSWHFRA
jgi:hypothetical protein